MIPLLKPLFGTLAVGCFLLAAAMPTHPTYPRLIAAGLAFLTLAEAVAL